MPEKINEWLILYDDHATIKPQLKTVVAPTMAQALATSQIQDGAIWLCVLKSELEDGATHLGILWEVQEKTNARKSN